MSNSHPLPCEIPLPCNSGIVATVCLHGAMTKHVEGYPHLEWTTMKTFTKNLPGTHHTESFPLPEM